MSESVFVAHLLKACRTLGPGLRGVVWVQGCSRRCPGCIAGPILGPGGERMPAAELAERILSWPDIDGVTFSGGEPMEQAGGLAAVCEILQGRRDISILSYTGFTLEALLEEADPARLSLLRSLDMLIDGAFERERQADLLWRGSANQRILLLSERHREEARHWDGTGAGVELHVRRDGTLFWAGVPEPRFAGTLRDTLAEEGVALTSGDGRWT